MGRGRGRDEGSEGIFFFFLIDLFTACAFFNFIDVGVIINSKTSV